MSSLVSLWSSAHASWTHRPEDQHVREPMREAFQQHCILKFTRNVPSFALQCSLVTARREHFRLWLQLSRVTEVLKACLHSTTEGCLEDCSGMLACISV